MEQDIKFSTILLDVENLRMIYSYSYFVFIEVMNLL